MKHHERKDLGIKSIISTARLAFESTDPENVWSDNAEMEDLVVAEFESQDFNSHVTLDVDDNTFNILRISASAEHVAEFNEAVDWTLEFMKTRCWLVAYLL
ncbi:hypothetical protein [Acinetobacter phage ABPH49]|nr:hypothetical protein [Acinetobacter phage ABPH49]